MNLMSVKYLLLIVFFNNGHPGCKILTNSHYKVVHHYHYILERATQNNTR